VLAHTDGKPFLKGGLVRSREPFKVWWARTVSLERLMVSDVVNLVRRWLS